MPFFVRIMKALKQINLDELCLKIRTVKILYNNKLHNFVKCPIYLKLHIMPCSRNVNTLSFTSPSPRVSIFFLLGPATLFYGKNSKINIKLQLDD